MVYGIILAAGKGTRFGAEKQSLSIKGKPIYQYSIDAFIESKKMDQILLVCPHGKKEKYKFQEVLPIEGGKERYDSVKNVLFWLKKEKNISDNDLILIHDSARPMIKVEYINEIIAALKDYPAATLGYRITDALKKVNEDNTINNDLDRNQLWAVTTPQGFHLKTLISLYEKSEKFLYDETHLFIQEGFSVKIIEKGRYNLKITYPEDLEVLQKLL